DGIRYRNVTGVQTCALPIFWKVATVQYNYHINVERMNYSVPYEYIKQQVDVRLTRTTVEIFFAGTRIASHLRLHGRPNQYSTVRSEERRAGTECRQSRQTKV